jgi:hypothetical protein
MTDTNLTDQFPVNPLLGLLPTARQCWQETTLLLAKKGYRIEYGQPEDGELAGLFWFTWENPDEPSWGIEAGESYSNENEAWLDALRHFFEGTRFISAEDCAKDDADDEDEGDED